MIISTKEQVFTIMGKYYGNAYWRSAVGCYSEEDLIFLTEILDKINALGYQSNAKNGSLYVWMSKRDVDSQFLVDRQYWQHRWCRSYFQLKIKITSIFLRTSYKVRSFRWLCILKCYNKKYGRPTIKTFHAQYESLVHLKGCMIQYSIKLDYNGRTLWKSKHWHFFFAFYCFYLLAVKVQSRA